ncbi:MAG: dihydrodipicolinate synthase family protein [Microvirga sp.]
MNKPVLPMSSLSVRLPTADRSIETYRLAASRTFPAKLEGTLNRVAFSAAHVVADPLADNDPWLSSAIDWDRTIAFREHVWDLGLGVAEAMDTAQRGMGLDWPTSLELIQRSVKAAKAKGNALVFSGAGTDHLAVEDARTIDDVIRAYEEQIAAVEKAGGRIILMASRALAKLGRSADDYAKVYNRVLGQVREPVIIHWLGDMFDPALAGYWGTTDLDKAMDTATAIINANAAKVDGVKVSLLDKQREIDMRRRLDQNVKMYTGDDFNYAELIAGDDKGFSHALLGIFDAIAPAAAAALSALAKDDLASFHDIFAPTVPLSRHIFRAPTRFYKTGVVFMAYLNGHQDHFTMAGGQESTRSTLHLAELFRLADRAGLFRDPERAAERMRCVMAVRGVEA